MLLKLDLTIIYLGLLLHWWSQYFLLLVMTCPVLVATFVCLLHLQDEHILVKSYLQAKQRKVIFTEIFTSYVSCASPPLTVKDGIVNFLFWHRNYLIFNNWPMVLYIRITFHNCASYNEYIFSKLFFNKIFHF